MRGGDGVVRTRLDLDVVRRVGVDEVDRAPRPGAGPRPRPARDRRTSAGGCPAPRGRPAASPPRPAVRARRPGRSAPRCRDVAPSIFSSSSVDEPEQLEVDVHAAQFRQLDGQEVHVPLGQLRHLVVGDAVGLDLRPASDRVATWTGTSSSPSFCAAFQRVCPTMMTPSASTTMGWRKPYSGWTGPRPRPRRRCPAGSSRRV